MPEAIWNVLNAMIRVLWFIFDTVTKITLIWSVRRQAMVRADIQSGKVIDPAVIEKHARFKREPK
ncbi:MAG: hypothetical protein ABSF41_11110 [Pseudolabrys sp.]|jgi:hypothetical protein